MGSTVDQLSRDLQLLARSSTSTIQSYMERIGGVRNSFSLESLEIWVPVQAVQLSNQRESVFLIGKNSQKCQKYPEHIPLLSPLAPMADMINGSRAFPPWARGFIPLGENVIMPQCYPAQGVGGAGILMLQHLTRLLPGALNVLALSPCLMISGQKGLQGQERALRQRNGGWGPRGFRAPTICYRKKERCGRSGSAMV